MEKWACMYKNSSSPAEKSTAKPAFWLHYICPPSGSKARDARADALYCLPQFFYVCFLNVQNFFDLAQHFCRSKSSDTLLTYFPEPLIHQGRWEEDKLFFFFQFPFSLTYMTFMPSSSISCWTVSVHFCFYLWLMGKAGAFIGSKWNAAVVHYFFRDNVQSSIGLELQMWREKRTKFESFGEEKRWNWW